MFVTRTEGGSYLPITPDIVQSVLSEAEVNPDGVVNSEWGRKYREGAMLTHRMLRYQAISNGKQLPTLSDDLVMAYFRDVAENSRPSIELEDLYAELGVKLSFADWELGRALTELTRYRPNKVFIYGGANDVYSLYRKYLEGRRLANRLCFP